MLQTAFQVTMVRYIAGLINFQIGHADAQDIARQIYLFCAIVTEEKTSGHMSFNTVSYDEFVKTYLSRQSSTESNNVRSFVDIVVSLVGKLVRCVLISLSVVNRLSFICNLANCSKHHCSDIFPDLIISLFSRFQVIVQKCFVYFAFILSRKCSERECFLSCHSSLQFC